MNPDFFEALDGPKRMWIGWWDHVRGNDMAGDRLAMGRAGFFDEVMRFYDEHLKGQRTPGKPAPVVYQAFDLLHLDGRSLLDVPLDERKRLLRSRLSSEPLASRLTMSVPAGALALIPRP